MASKQPNAWGLHDMSGNVSEWVQDVWHDSYTGAPTDGSARTSGGEQMYRVLRVGSWSYSASVTRAASRERGLNSWPVYRSPYYGFRVARTEP